MLMGLVEQYDDDLMRLLSRDKWADPNYCDGAWILISEPNLFSPHFWAVNGDEWEYLTVLEKDDKIFLIDKVVAGSRLTLFDKKFIEECISEWLETGRHEF